MQKQLIIMENYSNDYAVANDIDLLCSFYGKPSHFASNGTSLPQNFDVQTNELANRQFMEESPKCEVTILSENVNVIIDHSVFLTDRVSAFNNYIASFAMMARYGFYSYDVISEDADGYYYCVLIAKPNYLPKENISLNEPKPIIHDKIIVLEGADLLHYFSKK